MIKYNFNSINGIIYKVANLSKLILNYRHWEQCFQITKFLNIQS